MEGHSVRGGSATLERPQEADSQQDKLADLTFSEDYEWQRVTSDEGGFSVMMPGKPKEQTVGEGFTELHVYEVAIGRELTCSVEHFPVKRLEKFMRGGDEALLDWWQQPDPDGSERVTLTRKIAIGSHPGREYSLRKTKKGLSDVIFFHNRCYIVGDRFYVLLWAWHDGDIDHPDIQAFFRSFELRRGSVRRAK
jgi:hypothetical protein